jgi:hypothetical protein
LHESAHACVARALGLGVRSTDIQLAEDGSGRVRAHMPQGRFDTKERAFGLLLLALSGNVSEYLALGRNPIDALDSRFSAQDQRLIDESVRVLGRKAREVAVTTLEVALSESWGDVLALTEALENRKPPVEMPRIYATDHRGSGPIVVESRPKFDLPTPRDEVGEILDRVSLSFPSWEAAKPHPVKQLFSADRTKRTTRDRNGDVVSSVEETAPGIERLTDAFRALTEKLEGAVSDALKPRRTRKVVKRDAYGDISEVIEEELAA